MITLAQIGPKQLRRMVEEQQKAEPFAQLDDESMAGRVRRRGAMALSRKGLAAAKLLVDRNQHRDLIEAHVRQAYDSDHVRGEITKHIDELKNLLRQVADRIALCYHRPPTRQIRGIADDQAAKFLAAYRESCFDLKAERWNRYALILGVIHVLPRYEDGRLQWLCVTPDISDVVHDPDGEAEPSILVYETKSHGAARIAVDAERWWWLSEAWEVLHDEPHGLGMRPWVAVRWAEPPESDYWDRGHGVDLLKGTLELGRVYAHARWIRKNWAKKLVTVHTGANVHVPANQNMSANDPVEFKGDGIAEIDVHDLVVTMEPFRAEMAEIVESVLEGWGLPANVVDFATGSAEDAANVFGPAAIAKHDALTKIRDRQVKQFEEVELQLAVRAGALLRMHGRIALTDEQIRTGFRVRHAPMTFADHPKARTETYTAQMKLGQTNPYDIYMLENPGVTFEEALEYVDDNIKLRAKFYELWISSNMHLDPEDDLRTAAELNGKLGGQSKGTNANNDEDQENDDQ